MQFQTTFEFNHRWKYSNFAEVFWMCVWMCCGVCLGSDESVRTEGRGWCDCWQAPSRPAESPDILLALPPASPATQLPFSSLWPRLRHICCVLATESKLQHPGPLDDSSPYSHVLLLLSSSSLSPLLLSVLLVFSQFWSVFLSLSVIRIRALGLLQPCQISLPCLSFSHFCYTSHPPFLHCVTLQSVPSLIHIPSASHLLSYKQVPVV